MMSHVTDFPFGNDPSLKSIFVISPKIPEPQDPRLDLTWWILGFGDLGRDYEDGF